MADKVGSEQLEKRVETPAPDPIADRSMSGPLLVFSLLLVVTMLWSLYDEVIGERPWKGYQSEFVDRYTSHLKRIRKPQKTAEAEVKQSDEYQKLDAELQEAFNTAKPRVGEIDARVRRIDQQLEDINEEFQDARAWIAAKTFNLETTPVSDRGGIRADIEDKKRQKIKVDVHNDEGKEEERVFTFYELEEFYLRLTSEKSRLLAERVEVTKPELEARKKRDDYLQDHMIGLTDQQIGGLIDKMGKFDFSIKQIHVAEANIVDRCESCHLGTREPLTLTKQNMRGQGVFISHPDKELLEIHDPEQFGCSTCHGGNGRGTTSVEKAHGRYKHWLWPLYYKENIQAGCNQCHNQDRVTPIASVLNHGKDLFQNRGCVGCHRYEGFDRDVDALSAARQTIKQLDAERKELKLAVDDIRENGNEERARRMVANSAAMDVNQLLASVSQRVSRIDEQLDAVDTQSKYLMQDQKKVGPNLKEIKAKLRKEWLPLWLRDPQAFRPGTKMPTFRLDDKEVEAISAFLWQSALDERVASQPAGNAANGKELFKSIGCLACHSIDGRAIDMGDQIVGGDFAANLSRVGEKANYDYIVRWVHNPRERLTPYSPSLKRDLTRADYASKGLPFVFSDDQSTSPIDGRELQVQNMTVMPNFRLSDQDARDIATFLMTWKQTNPRYPDASYLDNTDLKGRGEELVRLYGCAGCHEIKGLEEEQRIGTELTPEGSKPIERLDFALLTHDAQKGHDPFTEKEIGRPSWYDHKGFFEYKLKSPGIYDRGKEKGPEERLRMPNIYLEDGDVTALTTFLLGSVVTSLPESIQYKPTGQKKDVQNGWWIIEKYNCVGCHNIQIGEDSVLMNQPMYQGDLKEGLPPRLTSEGARVNPDWLLKFLKDPSLSTPAERGSRQQQDMSLKEQPNRPPTLKQGQMPNMMAHLQGTPPAQAYTQQSGAPQQSGTTQPGTPTQAGQQPQATLGKQPGQNRNGVRQYLKVRMPTFNFSPNELQALVNFFMGASSQQMPYVPKALEPLTSEETLMARTIFQSQQAPCLKCHMTGDPGHDVRATAPNFLIAAERLKPDWTRRWMVDPQIISPGTSMPSGLFDNDPERNRWVTKGINSPLFQNYDKDHVSLLTRYMFQITAEEQRRLGTGGSSAPAGPPAAAPATGTTTGAGNATSSLKGSGPRRAKSRAPTFVGIRAP